MDNEYHTIREVGIYKIVDVSYSTIPSYFAVNTFTESSVQMTRLSVGELMKAGDHEFLDLMSLISFP